jgi:hypothetical protein
MSLYVGIVYVFVCYSPVALQHYRQNIILMIVEQYYIVQYDILSLDMVL